ncbi:hypothetical protein O3G_MSEX009633 [Manduca sexta]|uniref:Uncharacterized protein n=1 Tax=Manduca sexta TaxID=7130 RepID=A0A922CS23_MANSE|nr:hypothetical protein O3G_MSEX009633 [Manduca sexta]KAG6456292.1 hypothetical protein O3G_MSEX009633 [Manduca sexta]
MSLLSAVLQEANKATTEDHKKYREEVLPAIRDLTDRIQLLSWALQQNLVDTYVNFTTTKSLEQLNFKNRKANIFSDYDKCMNEIKKYEEQFKASDEEFKNCSEKLIKYFEGFKDFCVAVEGRNILQRAEHDFNRFNYAEAILAVKSLKNQLNSLNFEGEVKKALSNMYEQAENQLSLYIAQTSIEWEDIFTWSEKNGMNFLTYSLSVQQSDPILLKKILKTLYLTERINAELGLFSQFFINQLLHNIIRHNCDIFTEDHVGAVVFNIKIDLNDTNKPNYQTIFNNLMAVFEFLQSTLGSNFEGEQTFIKVFAESIRQKFFNKIIKDCIRNNLPSCNSSYKAYKDIVVELDAFNKFLIELKFVSSEESPLNKYIDDTECVLYNKKCDKLLSDVKNLLSESLSYGTIEVGAKVDKNNSVLDVSKKDSIWDLNKPIYLPKCIVSQNVIQIMKMITEHLEESSKLPDKYSKQLVAYIKDIAVMYQFVVPKKFKANLESCPSDIGLFFNNCFYLAHGLLGPPWSLTLPRPLADHLILVLLECVQDLRVLGLEKMSIYLQHQKNNIVQSIESKDSSAWSYETYEQLDCAINSAFTLMRDLKAAWLHILPARMYELAMCTLVQALCQAVLDRIFGNNKPLNEELVYMLALRVEDTIEEATGLFEEEVKFEKKLTYGASLSNFHSCSRHNY